MPSPSVGTRRPSSAGVPGRHVEQRREESRQAGSVRRSSSMRVGIAIRSRLLLLAAAGLWSTAGAAIKSAASRAGRSPPAARSWPACSCSSSSDARAAPRRPARRGRLRVHGGALRRRDEAHHRRERHLHPGHRAALGAAPLALAPGRAAHPRRAARHPGLRARPRPLLPRRALGRGSSREPRRARLGRRVRALHRRAARLVRHEGPAALVWGNLVAAAVAAADCALRPGAAPGSTSRSSATSASSSSGSRTCSSRAASSATPAVEASLLVLLEPVLNPIWTFLAAGERPGPWALVGGAIVLGATAWRAVGPALRARAAPAS